MLEKNMLRALLFSFLLLICIFSVGNAYGFEAKGQECSKCHTLSNSEAKDLLKNVIPDVAILDIRLSPASGFWEVYLESGGKKGLVYVDFPKKHFFSGPLISIADRKNLSQERLLELNKVDVSQIPLDDALLLGDPKARIRFTVFTDPECPFCAKLHQEMKKVINENKDIAFYLKMFPLASHPGAYEKSKSIVCEKSLTLLEKAFEKKPVRKRNCGTLAVDENIKLAPKLGITNLPMVILPDGTLLPGYKDAKTLIARIGN
jgi:thiol:disulfide interchange protein DsbC